MISFKEGTRVLVLAPHTDDGEFGCGATIAKLTDIGCELHMAAFSVCEQSVPRHLPENILIKELMQACNILDIDEKKIHLYRYPVRKFPENRQEILEDLIELREILKPEVVFMPSTYDTHQDHQVISGEGFRAFKNCTILGYEMPWNNMTFPTTFFSVLDEKYVQKKIAAMSAYKSQNIRSYSNEEFILSLARTRGVQIKKQFAEAFEVIRILF